MHLQSSKNMVEYFIVPVFFVYTKNPKNYFFVFFVQSLVPLKGKRCEKEDEKMTIKKKSQIIPVWFAGGFLKTVFCKEQIVIQQFTAECTGTLRFLSETQ